MSENKSDERVFTGLFRRRRNQRSRNENRKVSFVYSLLRALGKLIPPFLFRTKALYVLWLPRDQWRPVEVRPGLRWANEADVEQLEKLGQPPAKVKAHFERGGRAAIREEDGQVIGCMWFEPTAPAYEGWLILQLSNHDWWLSDIYVSPDHRGKGIANQLDEFGKAELATQGIENVAGVTNVLNYAVLQSSKKGRYKAVRIWYVRILGWTLVRLPRKWIFGWWGLSRSLQISFSELIGRREV